jgi:hypothetical protein
MYSRNTLNTLQGIFIAYEFHKSLLEIINAKANLKQSESLSNTALY